MKQENIKFPHINLNGTSKDSLAEAYLAACTATSKAIKAIEDAAPHGRDYLTKEDFKAATEQHKTRLLNLIYVYEELSELYGFCL